MSTSIYYKWFQQSLRPDQQKDYRDMSINQQKDWYINYLENHYKATENTPEEINILNKTK